MNRLTTFSKILIGLVIGAAIFFAANHFMGKNPINLNSDGTSVESNASTNSTSSTSAGQNSNAPAVEQPASSSSSRSSFDYTPVKPIGGKLMGVVELGASGFNSFIIRKDSDDNWEKEKYEWGNSFVFDQMANGKDIVSGLKGYIASILDYGVSSRNVHFVVSSGALKESSVQPIIASLKKMGYVVNTVTPAQEGQYALMSVLPKKFEGNAFVTDIGSGNTKVSWKASNRIEALEGPGAKYYVKEMGDAEVIGKLRTIGEKVPRHLTKTCFIIGGVPFNMAKVSRSDKERYTVLGSPGSYSKLAEEKGRKVECGLNIYQALQDGTGCKTFVFDWDANFTIGFLLSLPG